MACILFYSCLALRDLILDDPGMYEDSLPPCARPYMRQQTWRNYFIECFVRIAARLSKGIAVLPNCTGEEMAVRILATFAKDFGSATVAEVYGAFLDKLPSHPNDSNYELLMENALEDDDLQMLFPDDDFSDDDDEDGEFQHATTPFVEAFMRNASSQGVPARVCHLDPRDWFEAFRLENFGNHVSAPVQQA